MLLNYILFHYGLSQDIEYSYLCYTIKYLMHCDILLSLSILMNKLLHISPLGAHWLLCPFVMFMSFVYTSLFSDTTRCLGERIVAFLNEPCRFSCLFKQCVCVFL